MMSGLHQLERTSIQLYRDCLRLVRHVAPGDSPKSLALRTMVRQQFNTGRNETDPQRVEALKANAVRALSNYMLYESGAKDTKMKKAMTKFHDKSVESTKRNDD